MSKKVLIGKEIIATQINYLYIYIVGYFLLWSWVSEDVPVYRYPMYMLLPLVFFLVRSKVKRNGVNMLLHIVIATAFMCIPGSIYERVVFGALVVFMAVFSIFIRKKSDKMEDIVFHPSGIIALYLLIAIGTHGRTNETIHVLMRFALIVYVSSYFLHYYLQSFDDFVVSNQKSAGYMPEKWIFKTGFSFAIIFSVVSAIILTIISYFSSLNGIFKAVVGKMILGILNIMNRNPSGQEEIVDQGSVFDVPTSMQIDPSMIAETSKIAMVFDAMLVVASIGVIGLVIYLIARKMIQSFQISGETYKEKESSSITDKVEVVEKVKGEKLFEGFHFRETYQQKIRRIFREYMVGKNKKVQAKLYTKTARECMVLVNSKEINAESQYVEIYEKARYSNEDCTSLDVKHMLNIKRGK